MLPGSSASGASPRDRLKLCPGAADMGNQKDLEQQLRKSIVSETPFELTLEEDAATAAPADEKSAADASAEAFRFVEMLAGELSGGTIELPYLPDIAVRMRKMMDDPDCSLQQLGKALSAEPGLAARLLRMANSAQYNRTGKPLTEVTLAVNRLGFELVRNTCWTYALSQMQRQEHLRPVADQLVEQWQTSTDVAAMAFVVARETNVGQPDEALMAGMIHNVGTVYILSRMVDWEEASIGRETLDTVIQDWNCSIGRSIAENWELPEATIEAVANYRQLDRIGVGHPDLCDVLTIAVCLHEGGIAEAPELAAAQRMKLKLETLTRLMDEVNEERNQLRETLAA